MRGNENSSLRVLRAREQLVACKTSDQVAALAPDASSLKAGQGLASERRWLGLGQSERAESLTECTYSSDAPGIRTPVRLHPTVAVPNRGADARSSSCSVSVAMSSAARSPVIVGMTMTTGTYWERVGGLEFDIEDAECERLSAPGEPGPAGEGDRITALLALHGGGHTGLAEEIGLMEPADYDTYAELARSLPLAGRWTIASFAAHIRTLPLFAEPPQWELMRNFRTWGFESAALDLALRPADTSLPALLGLTPRPVTYVNSLGLGDPPSFAHVGQRLATYPEMRFKIDASFLSGTAPSSSGSRRRAPSGRSTSRATTGWTSARPSRCWRYTRP